MDNEYFLYKENQKPKEWKKVNLEISHELDAEKAAHGTIENFMMTTPRCESRAPPDYDMKEFDWNTYIFYKVYGKATRTAAQQICENEG